MREDIKKRIEQIKNGEVPEGYMFEKKYIYPLSWKFKKLGNITKRVSVKNKNLDNYPAYSINNQVGFIPQNEQFEQGSYIDLDKSAYKIVCRGQFAYNPARINVGSIGLLKDAEQAIVSSLYVCFALREDFDINYFENWFQTYAFYKETIRNLEGSVREYLFYENFSNINIVIPNKIQEQKKIAEILNHCDKVIELKKQLVEEEQKRKKWLMQNLLNPDSGVRLPGFSEKWTKVVLKNICNSINDGDWIESKDQSESGFRLIQTGNIGINKFLNKKAKAKYISEDTFYNLKCTEVLNGDILLSRLPDPIGRICIIKNLENRSICAVDCTIIRFKCQTTAEYFAQYASTDSYFKQLANLAGGSTRTRISRKEIENLEFCIPANTKEQAFIVSILSTSDSIVEVLERELNYWQQKKKALMQLLLTGIVRVTS